MNKRDPAVCVILMLITFGIYGFYWLVQLHNNMTELADPAKKTGGGTVLLLTVITFGIYGLYWVYTMAGMLDKAMIDRLMPPKKNGVLFLLLQFFGLGWINLIMLQSNINTLLDNPKSEFLG